MHGPKSSLHALALDDGDVHLVIFQFLIEVVYCIGDDCHLHAVVNAAVPRESLGDLVALRGMSDADSYQFQETLFLVDVFAQLVIHVGEAFRVAQKYLSLRRQPQLPLFAVEYLYTELMFKLFHMLAHRRLRE